MYVPPCLLLRPLSPTFGPQLHHAALSALSLTPPSAISCPGPEQENGTLPTRSGAREIAKGCPVLSHTPLLRRSFLTLPLPCRSIARFPFPGTPPFNTATSLELESRPPSPTVLPTPAPQPSRLTAGTLAASLDIFARGHLEGFYYEEVCPFGLCKSKSRSFATAACLPLTSEECSRKEKSREPRTLPLVAPRRSSLSPGTHNTTEPASPTLHSSATPSCNQLLLPKV